MPQMLPLAVALFYAFALFLFASWAEGDSHPVLKQRLRPPAYALALAVYCTSWTYYGAVGSAVADGWSYLPIYLGPVLVFVVAHPFLRRLIDAVKTDGANSISEFIGGRFGNSQGVAALVTILALLGSIPYLALQLRSLGTTYALIAGTQAGPLTIGFAAALLALFAMIYGTRRYEAGSRNDAILFAVSFESVLKLGALLVAGFIAVLLLAKAPEGAAQAGIAELSANFAPSRIGIDFFVITFLSMAAIVCLPRQFYVTVIEARSSADITAARWPFVIYMLLTLLVVLPISAAGMALLPGDSRPDLFVLQLPLSHGWTGAALLIFLGGFSAATAMALVETIALSTMVSNDLIAPFLVRSRRFEGEGNLGRVLLTTRRAAIAGIMGAALAWALGMGDSQRLASIGLVAFAAMAQFAPALVMAVMGGNRDALAAKASLGAGLLVWIYTLALPQLASPAMLRWMEASAFNPHALFGIDGLSPISHGTIWSLGANIAVFALMTMRRVQPHAFPALLRMPGPSAAVVSNVGELKALAARFVGPEVTAETFAGVEESRPIDRAHRRRAERLIASVVGVPSARAFVSSALYGSNLTHEEVARILDDTGQSLRFSKGLLASILENIDQGVSLVDRDLNLVAWNGRYLEMFHYPPGLVRVGAPVAELVRYNAERGECGPGEVEAHIERRLQHMRRGQAHSFKRVRPDGRIVKTVGGPMPGGGYVMSFTDVTAEEQAIAALEKARAELEMRIEDRTSELRAANVALAEADAEKTRFLAAASHDLLQPLHAARLFSAALGRDLSGSAREVLGKLDRSIQSAEALLRSLLDISKLDAGGISPNAQPLQIRPLLAALVETMRPLALEKGLDIRLGPGDATVETDPGLLRSIVQNFLSNAIRYTQAGGIVVGVRRRGSRARIDVIDTGPGIAEEKYSVIFREFERLPNASEGGIGLGLAIVERTARLLGGRVSLRSKVGKGSRFSIALPVSLARVGALGAALSEPAGGVSPLSILVVDDDATNCEALQGWLGRLGHKVTTATTAASALSGGNAFDVALVDFNLGGELDGIALIEVLRRRAADARYALVTAARESSYAARAAALGITVMRKPLSPPQLEQWLGQTESRHAAE